MDSTAGRILVVDDDASLLSLLHVYLGRVGYRVDACPNAEVALALLEANPNAYTMALVDLNMPGMGGRQLAERILRCNPVIRLIFVSGYPAGLSGLDTLEGQSVEYLQKPFSPAELVAVARAAAG